MLVAAFRSSLSASYRLLPTIEREQWRPIISPALALEYESVLKRSLGDINDFTEYLCSRGRLVQIYFRWRPMLLDPDDDRILKVAVRTGSPIVTFNVRDFHGSESLGIKIMGPAESLAIVGDQR